MHKITIFPLGNADSCLINLDNGQKILFDYGNQRNPNDPDDLRIDLAEAIRNDLAITNQDYIDVVAFTHLDKDHYQRASEFFHLEHDKEYQGKDRIKIPNLWVPAAVIIEEDCQNEAAIIQAEARYRLLQGRGIRVFSQPELLEQWLKKHGLSLKSREHLITDAGQLIPDFTLGAHGVEFFVHSPFASRLERETPLDRNTDSLIVQATFVYKNVTTKLMLASDATWEILATIVSITEYHDNESRLEWNIMKIPHHCSYLSLSPDRGKEKTAPVAETEWLFEEQGLPGGIMVSTSKPIPTDDSDVQPPHRQTANYYKDIAKNINGEFIVTMEHPSKSAPEPLVITVDQFGATVKKRTSGVAGIISSRPSPRAGYGL